MACQKVAPTFSLCMRFPSNPTSMSWVDVRDTFPEPHITLTSCSRLSQGVLCRTGAHSADLSYWRNTQTNFAGRSLRDVSRSGSIITSSHQTFGKHRVRHVNRPNTPSSWNIHPPLFDRHAIREPWHCRRPRSPPFGTPASRHYLVY